MKIKMSNQAAIENGEQISTKRFGYLSREAKYFVMVNTQNADYEPRHVAYHNLGEVQFSHEKNAMNPKAKCITQHCPACETHSSEADAAKTLGTKLDFRNSIAKKSSMVALVFEAFKKEDGSFSLYSPDQEKLLANPETKDKVYLEPKIKECPFIGKSSQEWDDLAKALVRHGVTFNTPNKGYVIEVTRTKEKKGEWEVNVASHKILNVTVNTPEDIEMTLTSYDKLEDLHFELEVSDLVKTIEIREALKNASSKEVRLAIMERYKEVTNFKFAQMIERKANPKEQTGNNSQAQGQSTPLSSMSQAAQNVTDGLAGLGKVSTTATEASPNPLAAVFAIPTKETPSSNEDTSVTEAMANILG